jgi:hypothetical protein
MQRPEDGLIVIVCDFCRRDWDGVEPMIEGHHGSVICLECLKSALHAVRTDGAAFSCTLCLKEKLAGAVGSWQQVGSDARVCQDCLRQAAKAFSKNADVAWKWDGLLVTLPPAAPKAMSKDSA